MLEQFAFSECESLEEVNIPSSLHYYSYGVFSHCHNLKTINSHNEINYIDDLAFYNCKNLENFNIPSNTSSIGRMAFMGCEKIKEITIPKKTDCIEIGAFSLMSSLEKISVEEGNKKYFTLDDDTVLVSDDGVIIQYAINSDNELYITYFCCAALMRSSIICFSLPQEIMQNRAAIAAPITNTQKVAFQPSELCAMLPKTIFESNASPNR